MKRFLFQVFERHIKLPVKKIRIPKYVPVFVYNINVLFSYVEFQIGVFLCSFLKDHNSGLFRIDI